MARTPTRDREALKNRGDRPANLAELGAFIRSRRRLVSPERMGLSPKPGRRTPGLRREDVSELAGISSSWYTRVELGTAGVPSAATLYAIARALQLEPPEIRYVFALAGLPLAAPAARRDSAVSPTFNHVLLNLTDAATAGYDWYGTPHCWNSVADGIFRWSSHDDEFHRNVIVAGLSHPYYRDLTGAEYEKIARGVIGTFRRAYMTSEPTELARRIFDFGMKHPIFRSIWNDSSIAESFTDRERLVRNVPAVGRLTFDYIDLIPAGEQDLILRVLSPADPETRAKLPLLESIGTARPLAG